MIQVKLEGIDEVNKKIKEAMKKFPEEAKKGVELSCIKVEKEAKHLAPVDTGRLKNSITYEIKQDGSNISGVIGSDVDYAPYVELGTVAHLAPIGKWGQRHGFGDAKVMMVSGKAQPFLLPALLECKDAILTIFKDILAGFKV